MALERLQINLLSNSGELLHCITCHAGQVSVFRAPSYAALQVYQRALVGIPGPERISILLNDRPFVPSEHIFIGFGEHLAPGDNTVLSLFRGIHTHEAAIISLLNSFGIEATATTLCSSLTKCEERRARLLAATQHTDKVLVLNDPLEPLANQWRERIADLLAQYARTKKQMVVVTSLSYRPETWIDNPCIARIQVGEEIQRTIGFGTAPSSANDMVAQLREMMKDDAKVQAILSGSLTAPELSAAPAATVQSSRPEETHASPLWAVAVPVLALFGKLVPGLRQKDATERAAGMYSFLAQPAVSAGIAASIILAGGLSLLGSNGTTEVAMTQVVVPVVEEVVDVKVKPETPVEPVTEAAQTEPAKLVPPAEEAPQLVLALDEYSSEVRHSIINGFHREYRGAPASADTAPQQGAAEPAVNRNQEAGELLRLLESASNTGDKLAPDPVDAGPPSGVSDTYTFQGTTTTASTQYRSEEEKREAIRKKFLEAIERAQEMRRNNQGDGGAR